MSTPSDEHGRQAHGHAPRFERRHHAGTRGQARAEATEVVVGLGSRQTPAEKEDSPSLGSGRDDHRRQIYPRDTSVGPYFVGPSHTFARQALASYADYASGTVPHVVVFSYPGPSTQRDIAMGMHMEYLKTCHSSAGGQVHTQSQGDLAVPGDDHRTRADCIGVDRSEVAQREVVGILAVRIEPAQLEVDCIETAHIRVRHTEPEPLDDACAGADRTGVVRTELARF